LPIKKKPASKPPRAKKPALKKAAPVKTSVKKRSSAKSAALDLSSLPSALVTQDVRTVCLACVLDVMTRHLGLSTARAQLEIKRYTPSLQELQTKQSSRPFFIQVDEKTPCPYCQAATKWHARVAVHRIESTKATDPQRRALLKHLKEPVFAVLEEKATQQDAFFQWLERVGTNLDLDDPRWLGEISRHYLARKEPKTDWNELFAQVRSIRRSRRLDEGWEIDQSRLFLAPMLFDELLLVQYLVSRAHRAGGLTLEGRHTLPELVARLRQSGYLRSVGIGAQSPSDAFEQLLTHLGGGDTSQRFYYIIDRSDLLERIKALKDSRVPRAKQRDSH